MVNSQLTKLLLIFFCFSSSLQSMELERLIPSFALINQTEMCFKYINYASAILVAAYPLYYGFKSIKQCIIDEEKGDLPLEALKSDSSLVSKTNVEDLELIVKEIKDELKKPQLSKIRFATYKRSISGTNAKATNRSLYFYNSFFRLSREEQKSVIGHECIHILENHNLIMGIFSLLTPIGSYYMTQIYFNFLKINQDQASNAANLYLAIASPILSFCLTNLTLTSLSWYLEKRADLESSRSFESVLGGVKFFNPYKINLGDQESSSSSNNNAQKTDRSKKSQKKISLLKSIDYLLQTLYGINAHPSHQERFAYFCKKLISMEKELYQCAIPLATLTEEVTYIDQK